MIGEVKCDPEISNYFILSKPLFKKWRINRVLIVFEMIPKSGIRNGPEFPSSLKIGWPKKQGGIFVKLLTFDTKPF